MVEKRSQRLFVLNKQKDSIVAERSYLCSTGKVSGNKKRSGDLKTPEGIYFLNEKIDSSALPPKYGAGAYVLDYPNGFDQIIKRKGYGIWIHGTNEPERLEKSMDTRGCVIVKDEDFIDLAQYVELYKTPVVIVDEVQYRNIEYVNRDKKETMEFLENWKVSWQSKSLENYIKLYSKDFRRKKMNIQSYRSYKKRLFRKYDWIKLRLSNIQIFRNPQYIVINFIQEYSADTYSDFGVKQLFLIKENNSFRIIKENWTEIQN
ncbi:MAG: L,D-transpeptidase [Candidatus Aminicenantes bacterium]|nr:MAG: L,D-transpeptidase [Candidatus Aminicenantes bacterium]